MEKKKILIVDDDQDSRGMSAEVFKNAGYDVLEAEDGLAGLDLAIKNIPDIILTGIVMPKMDGWGLIENLNKNVATASIPVAISSHLGKEADRQKSNMVGAKDFFVRGFVSPREVVQRVSAILDKGGKYRLDFDTSALDAQKLAENLKLEKDFACLECGGKMNLILTLTDPKNIVFEAKFVCPKCGWEAK